MISEIIKNRRAVFPVQYNNEAISKEEIHQLLEAANWAPTHRRTEPWRFKVFLGDSKIKLAEFLASVYERQTPDFSEFKQKQIRQKCEQSACMIAICMQRDLLERLPEWEEIAATAMAVQNIWLQATEMKIGMYWSSPSYMKSLGTHIDLAKGERCIGFIYMGKYDGELPEGTRLTPISEKTTWI